MSEDLANIMGNFIKNELDAFEQQHNELDNIKKERDKYKIVLDKIKDELKEGNEYLENAQELYSQHDDELVKALAIQLINNNLVHNDNILKLLEEIE